MSLNSAHMNGGVLIHQGEMILLHAKNVQLAFSGSYELKFGEKTGNAYLTTHRLIFLRQDKKMGPNDFQSFSFPFVTLKEVDVDQPVFGANALKGKVRAQPNGKWTGEAKFKMTFKNGGAIDFGSGMLKAIHLTKQMNNLPSDWSQPPPAYNDIGGSATPAPPNYYQSQASYYGWNTPTGFNFPNPDQGTIYVAEVPPPYPGIGIFPGNQNMNMNGGGQQNYGMNSGNGYGQGQAGFGYPNQQPMYPNQQQQQQPMYPNQQQQPIYPNQQQQPMFPSAPGYPQQQSVYQGGQQPGYPSGFPPQQSQAYGETNSSGFNPPPYATTGYAAPPMMNGGSKKSN